MANVIGDSDETAVPAVSGTNTAEKGVGVYAHSKSGRAVVAESDTDYGLRASSRTKTGIRGSSVEHRGVEGQSTIGDGVVGQSDGAGAGVLGISKDGPGVRAKSVTGYGLEATSGGAAAIRGISGTGRGVEGQSTTSDGVVGQSDGKGSGVIGVSIDGVGVHGKSHNGMGVLAISVNLEGIRAETTSTSRAAIACFQNNSESDSPALFVKHAGNRNAAVFEGNVVVTGDITLANADCAEDFDISAGSAAEPGTVMVLDDASELRESFRPYDKRVAGVISGAGNFKPGLVLDKQSSQSNRKPIALLGKAFCKVDAQFGSIEVGDLLTTSPTAGHAMRADDPSKAFGAVIGKALRPLTEGQGIIPILIALQ